MGQEKLFNLIVWKLHRKEQMVSQKSKQPRGAGSDFLGKKNVSLPTARTIFSKGGVYIQHRTSSEPGTLTKPGLRGSLPHVPASHLASKPELEVKQTDLTPATYRRPRSAAAGQALTFAILANANTGGSQQVMGSMILTWLPIPTS